MKKVNTEKVCVVIRLNCRTFDFDAPRYGAYENKHVTGVIPCAQIGDKYFDLRTSKEVKVQDDKKTLVWNAYTGDTFEYPDGKLFLLTRWINPRVLMYGEIAPEEFHQETMVRHKVM